MVGFNLEFISYTTLKTFMNYILEITTFFLFSQKMEVT